MAAVAANASPHCRVWIDVFAVRQWPGNVADLVCSNFLSACACMIVHCCAVAIFCLLVNCYTCTGA